MPGQQVGDGAEQPGFDPGGDTALPFEIGPPPGQPGTESPDGGPIEGEPLHDPDARAAPTTPEAAPGPEEVLPVPPIEGSPPASPPTPGSGTEPPPSGDDSPPLEQPLQPEPQVLAEEDGADGSPIGRLRANVKAPAAAPLEALAPVPAPAAPPASAPAPAAPVSAPPVTQRIAATKDAPSPRSARTHTVRAGESLWTIAERLVGPDASATAIAAEVARLWELNRERIGSGDPSLIYAGTTLRLR